LRKENRIAIDPDLFLNCDRDRDCDFKIAIRLKKLHRRYHFSQMKKCVIPQITTPRISRRTRIQMPGTPPIVQMRTVARS